MKKYGKAGLLIFTLVMPALIFLFLKYFGANHYELPYLIPLKDSLQNVRINNGDTVFVQLEKINLNEFGEPGAHLPVLNGNYTVVGCITGDNEDSTKRVLSQLERIHSLRGNIKQVSVVSIADSVESMKWKSVVSDGWSLGVGNTESVEKALDALHLKDELKQVPLFAKLVLIDDNGYTRGFYDGRDAEDVDRLMAEIKILKYERDNAPEN